MRAAGALVALALTTAVAGACDRPLPDVPPTAESPLPPGTPEEEAAPASEALPPPAPGTARVSLRAGLTSVWSRGAARLPVLERLARLAEVELVVAAPAGGPLTVRFDDLPLERALAQVLRGVPYSLDYRFDDHLQMNVLHLVYVGEPGAEPAGSIAAPQVSDPEAVEAHGRALYAEISQRAETISSEERERLLAEQEARREAAEPELLPLLENPDPRARAAAVAELPLEGSERIDRVIALLSSDPAPEVRRAAAERLGGAESESAREALGDALSDPDRQVVLQAIEALEDLNDPAAIRDLEPLLDDPDPEIREAAEFAIGYLDL